MAVCKKLETRHHRMSWVLFKPHPKSKYQKNSDGYFVLDSIIPKDYQMDMFASFSTSFISSNARHYPVLTVWMCQWLFGMLGPMSVIK